MASLKSMCRAVSCESVHGAKMDWEEQDEWQQNAHGFSVTLKYQGRRYTFDFWQGSAITADPTAEGCLECLLSDAASGDSTFEDFCAELGYDQDSRKAERVWKACKQTRSRLERLLGADFDSFMEAERGVI